MNFTFVHTSSLLGLVPNFRGLQIDYMPPLEIPPQVKKYILGTTNGAFFTLHVSCFVMLYFKVFAIVSDSMLTCFHKF